LFVARAICYSLQLFTMYKMIHSFGKLARLFHLYWYLGWDSNPHALASTRLSFWLGYQLQHPGIKIQKATRKWLL
jgi:hypothetical protein